MSDTSQFGFGKFVPGFDFLQSLAKGASSGIPQMPQLSNWVAPTLSVQELEKRIDELKAVQFWLEQNSRALTATIQALEVQKMTLATLQGMNVSMGDVANAFKFQGADSVMQGMQKAAETFTGTARAAAASPAPQPAVPEPTPPAPPPPAPAAPSPAAASAEPEAPQPGVVDPLHWWSALTTQFQEIASTALKDAAQHSGTIDGTQHFAKNALKKATDMASHLAAQGVHSLQEAARAAQAPAPAKNAATKVPAKPHPAAKTSQRAPAPKQTTAAKKTITKKPAAKKAASAANKASATTTRRQG